MSEDKYSYEKEIQEFWKSNSIYEKAQEKNKGKDKFNHIDGPPFPTGEPHVGHLRNWAIKDSVLRLKRLQGYDVYARDGYDVHGLPVEIKVQQQLGLKDVEELQKFGEENFVKECKKYVASVINNMQERRERYGLWMNRDHYQTSHPEYLSMAWSFFKKAHEKDMLYKDNKVVAWSPGAETTLSDYEIKDSYAVLEDPSIYVKFELENSSSEYKESFVIWTTTPWTLQSNVAIAMNPIYTYVKALVSISGNKEVLIVAKELLDHVISTLSKQNEISLLEIIEEKKGAEFEGTKYKHILLGETPSQQEFANSNNPHIHAIVLADYVTLGGAESHLDKLAKKSTKHSIGDSSEEVVEEEQQGSLQGTGLVHIAPGHGFDDFEVGRKYNLPVFSPVDSKAILTEGKFEGMYFKDADKHVIEYLTKKGNMLFWELKKHKYPLCWRTKVPIIYRAVDQWWVKRSELVPTIMKQNDGVSWYPEFAKESFNNLMEKVTDWPISRQRFWGIPLPIFEDEDGNYEVFGSKKELEERIGKELEDIHKDDLKGLEITNEKTGKVMKAVPYTADVWFDSGCASFASHYGEGLSLEEIQEKFYPMNWITEGEDQIRGWFSSLFNVGHLVTEKAPYNQVLFQGFVMAKDGTKMSKSLGNGIDGNEAIELFGSDATRYYLLTKAAPEAKLNFDREEFGEVYGFFNTLENSCKYVNSYLKEYIIKEDHISAISALDVEDKWLLFKLNDVLLNFSRLMSDYKINQAFKEVEEFVVRDFSKTYLKLIKERTDERDEHLLALLSQVLRKVLLMLSPAIPFKVEKLYQELSLPDKKESIFLESFPDSDEFTLKKIKEEGIDKNFDLSQDIVQAILNAREKVKIGVRWPLGQIDIASSRDLSSDLKPFEKLIKNLTNVAKVQYDLAGVDIDYRIKPNFATLKQDFENMSDAIKCINVNKHYITEDIKKGLSTGTYDEVELEFDKHLIKEIELKGDLISSEFTQGSVILHTHQDDILLEEGYLRETIRRIQMMRKELGFSKEEEIVLSFEGSDMYYIDLAQNWSGVICKKVGASEIVQGELENKQKFDIKGKELELSLKRN